MTTMSATRTTTLLNPDSKPLLKDINKYVKPLTTDKWYDIGLELGVGDEDGEFLDGIKSSCGDNDEKCFMEMMKTWVRSASDHDSSEVTWTRLLHCLKELGLQEAVKRVEDNLQSSTSTEESLSSKSHDSSCSQQSDQEAPATEEHSLLIESMPSSLDSSLITEQDITSTQTVQSDSQLESRNEPEEHPLNESTPDSTDSSLITASKDSTSTQTVQSDSQLESRDEPQITAPMVPLFIDPSDTVPTESVPDQTSPGSLTNPPSQLPISITPPESPAAENFPDSGPVEYSIKFKFRDKIRNYQQELAKPGINGENYIFVAPTGSGKTLVAAMVICEHLKKVQALGEIPKVIFLVTTKPLAEQQQEKLQDYIEGAKVACVMGDSIGSIKDELTQCEIVVCTTGKFVDELKRDWVSLTPAAPDSETSTITLLVMDECHHARKSSAQAKLMHRYLKLKLEDRIQNLPQVIGLTASPGAGDHSNLEIGETVDHLVGLCALLDATSGIVTVQQNVNELERYTTKPVLSRKVQSSRSEKEEFIALIQREMTKLEGIAKLKCSFPKWSQQYETAANQMKLPLEISTNPSYRDQISALKLLICYSQALNIYMDLRREDALKVLNEYTDLPDLDDKCTECEKTLKKDLHHLKSLLNSLPRVENPLLKIAEEDILPRFKDSQKSRGVFFVRTKRHAYAVCEWIKSLDVSHSLLKPQVITGHTRNTGHGMTQNDQQLVMEDFRSGECNILVATSVAEEGLDVPACNFVIRFQHVSNEIAKAQTQGRARAEDSEVITILSSDSEKNIKEIQNAERLELVNTIIRNNWLPRGKLLQKKLEEQQESVIQNIKWKNLFKERRGSVERDQVKIMCRKCKAVACYGSDVFIVENSSHHVIPGDEIKTKLIPKLHHKPGHISETISKTHKIYCKECDADWGIMCFWLNDGFEFPVLKCKSFIFQIGAGAPFTVAQWSKAPFQALPLKAWIARQQADDESDSDTDSQ